MKKNEQLSGKFRRFFQLPTSPVAITVSEKEMTGPRPRTPSLFCELVRKAAHDGQTYLVTENDLQSFAARVILGFAEPKYVDLYPRIKPAKTKSVMVAPLEEADLEPDVIVVISFPARMMQIVQVLCRATKKRLEASMTCEASAIAGEATALPYMEKRPNLTLLCGGARGLAGYAENELALGIPFKDFDKLVDALVEKTVTSALCGCLMDEIPRHLKEAFVELGFSKGTDHFYGDFDGKVFRFYLNKDERGLMTAATIHYPMKFKSEQEAGRSVEVAKQFLGELRGESAVVPRENWLDLILTVKFPEGLEKLALDRGNFKKALLGILTEFSSAIDKIVP